MRLCMVSEDCAPNPGGMGTHVYQLSRALVRAGVDLTLLMGYGKAYASGLEALDLSGMKTFEYTYDSSLSSRYWLNPARRRKLRELHRAQPFDVVHWHCLFGETLMVNSAFRRGHPARVFTNHSSGFLARLGSPVWRRFMGYLLGRADFVIAPSEELLATSVGLGLPPERVGFIPNGVDCLEFTPAPQRVTEPVVVTTRRLVPKCGVDVLVEAFALVVQRVPEARLVIAGDGPQRAELEARVDTLDLRQRVTFLGNVPRTRIAGLYQAAALAAMPSRVEAVSISALEAMACGLPVVSTDVGGLPSIVRPGETGILVPSEAPGPMADGLVQLLTDPAEAERLGSQARRMVETSYSWDVIAARVLEVYSEARLTATSR